MTDTLRVERSILVPCDVVRTFDLWVRGFGAWWPQATHSFGGDRVVGVTLEPRIGGRIFERWADGTTREWGTVTAWDPPNRIGHTWYLGFTRDESTDVEVRFDALGPDLTRVTVTQTGFERLGEDGPARRDGNERGWASVLEHFGRHLGGR